MPAVSNQIQNFTYTYEESTKPHLFNKIEALDQTSDATGGFVELIDGGVGAQSMQLLFRSSVGNGIDFLVLIYGVRSNSQDFMWGQFESGNVLLYRCAMQMEKLLTSVI